METTLEYLDTGANSGSRLTAYFSKPEETRSPFEIRTRSLVHIIDTARAIYLEQAQDEFQDLIGNLYYEAPMVLGDWGDVDVVSESASLWQSSHFPKWQYFNGESLKTLSFMLRRVEMAAKYQWMQRAQKLESSGRLEAAIDQVYDNLDDLLLAERYDMVDDFLRRFEPKEYSVDLFLAVLTVTRSYRDKLGERPRVCAAARIELLRRGKNPEALLTKFD